MGLRLPRLKEEMALARLFFLTFDGNKEPFGSHHERKEERQ
jgi:hypothetical protein